MQSLQSQMTSLKQEREKLMDQYTTLNKSALAAQYAQCADGIE